MPRKTSDDPKRIVSSGTRSRPRFDHQAYVPYLLRRITDTLVQRLNDRLAPYSITVPMWRILAVLHGRGSTRFGILARQTLIEPPTLSRMVEELRSLGLITKASSEVDARGVLLVPTRKGLNLVNELTPMALALEHETLAGLTDDEAELFRRLTKRVCATLAPFAPDDAGHN
jgi:DNA-binding MarR family transcriptional regulator